MESTIYKDFECCHHSQGSAFRGTKIMEEYWVRNLWARPVGWACTILKTSDFLSPPLDSVCHYLVAQLTQLSGFFLRWTDFFFFLLSCVWHACIWLVYWSIFWNIAPGHWHKSLLHLAPVRVQRSLPAFDKYESFSGSMNPKIILSEQYWIVEGWVVLHKKMTQGPL